MSTSTPTQEPVAPVGARGERAAAYPSLSVGLADALARRLGTWPAVRSEAVAGARARLAAGTSPSPAEVADALLVSVQRERLA